MLLNILQHTGQLILNKALSAPLSIEPSEEIDVDETSKGQGSASPVFLSQFKMNGAPPSFFHFLLTLPL